ncbi:MAG: hypothetical protein WCW33_06460 [Candidatus Babeliales bacterium]
MKISTLRALACCAVLMMATGVNAHNNKTFMAPRPDNVNVPWWHTTFEDLVFEAKNNSCGNAWQLTGLYQESSDRDDVGKYFLIHDKNIIKFNATKTQESDLDPTPVNTVGAMEDVDITYVINYAQAFQSELDTINNGNYTLELKPSQQVVGVGLSYHQRFDWALSGLFFYANAPVVAMKRGVHLTLNHSVHDDISNVREDELYSYFAGGLVKFNFEYPPFYNAEFPPTGRGQKPLTHAKLTGSQGTAGFSDVDFGLGWAFLDRPKYHAAIAIAATIPAGNKPTGEYAFEPIRGNGGHWALGGNLDAWYRLFKGTKQNLRVAMRAELRYLFESHETRTLGLKNRLWGQYYLLGQSLGTAYDADTTITQKIPAANVLTRSVDVTPGLQFDGTLSFVYTNGGWSADLGWNPYARESEDVHMRGDFPDGIYAVASRGFNTAREEDGEPASGEVVDHQFTISAANVDDGNVATATVNNSTIDVNAARTPSQFTNAIYGSVAHMWDRGHKHATIVALGGKYEFASENSALEQWNVWAKMGLEF